MTTQFISSEPPAIRHESDIIAYTMTTLGYWPQRSLAIVLAPQGTVGPVLRIDVDLLKPFESAGVYELLTQTLNRTPEILDSGGQLFAVFFGETQHPRTHKTKNPMAQLSYDQEEAEQTAPFVQAIHRFTEDHNLRFADALYVGQETYWGVLYPHYQNVLVGKTQEILESPLSVYMIAEGKCIDESQDAYIKASIWNPTESTTDNRNWFQDARQWFESYRTQKQENGKQTHASYRQTVQSQLNIWDFAIQEIIPKITEARNYNLRQRGYFETVEHLAPEPVLSQIGPQIAGYLASTMDEPAFIHHLLYLALTNQKMSTTVVNSFQVLSELLDGDDETATTASCILPLGTGKAKLEKICLQLLNPKTTAKKTITKQAAMRNLDKIARTISGNIEATPNWQRIEALEILCLIALEIAQFHEKYNVLVTLAWISWLKGKSTTASKLLDEATNFEHSSEPVLLAALQSSALPQVALSANTSWATYALKLNSPRQR